MIVLDETNPEPDYKYKSDEIRTTFPSSESSEQLPSFEESTSHVPLGVFQTDHLEGHIAPDPPYQDPPPSFSPYVSSYFAHSDGSIVSHDAHLNEDGI
jgi:hypothetical protein